jgi:hypothetical protein
MRKIIRNAEARLRVFYAGGGWTHNLHGNRFALDVEGERVMLIIEMPARRESQPAVEAIQIAKPAIRKSLKEVLQTIECPEFCVALAAGKRNQVYPASAVFGPEAVTLTLG